MRVPNCQEMLGCRDLGMIWGEMWQVIGVVVLSSEIRREVRGVCGVRLAVEEVWSAAAAAASDMRIVAGDEAESALWCSSSDFLKSDCGVISGISIASSLRFVCLLLPRPAIHFTGS